MAWHRSVIAKFRNLISSGKPDGGFDAEVEAHLAMLAERFVRQGVAPEDAWFAGRRQVGLSSLSNVDRRVMCAFQWWVSGSTREFSR
jgi:hypothetical protein